MRRVGLVSALALALLLGSSEAQPQRRMASVAVLTTGGASPSRFCTKDGSITVAHGGTNGGKARRTLITGPAVRRLGEGAAHVPPGCYDHVIANTTVVGGETAKSTVWYVPQ